MSARIVTLPELGLISGTRAALGVGVGLLVADKLTSEQRRAVGWTLVAVGVITTFPLAAQVFLRENPSDLLPRQGRGGERGQREFAGTTAARS
ncbi:MAG TPA: hypothetical protein VLI90_16740 [Tepidisphaeraceae bacterium]|nr:hypothetical protein [Tepidisphaeraceae bacterium]